MRGCSDVLSSSSGMSNQLFLSRCMRYVFIPVHYKQWIKFVWQCMVVWYKSTMNKCFVIRELAFKRFDFYLQKKAQHQCKSLKLWKIVKRTVFLYFFIHGRQIAFLVLNCQLFWLQFLENLSKLNKGPMFYEVITLWGNEAVKKSQKLWRHKTLTKATSFAF